MKKRTAATRAIAAVASTSRSHPADVYIEVWILDEAGCLLGDELAHACMAYDLNDLWMDKKRQKHVRKRFGDANVDARAELRLLLPERRAQTR